MRVAFLFGVILASFLVPGNRADESRVRILRTRSHVARRARQRKVLQKNPAFLKLLKKCFDEDMVQLHGPPINDVFTIKAEDNFRLVEMSFVVTGQIDRSKCIVEMRDGFGSSKEKIKSVYKAAPDIPVVRENNFMAAWIQFNIYSNGAWELDRFFSNNLLSPNLIRSLLVQGMEVHSMWDDQSGIRLHTRDHCSWRETYWLEHCNGNTYYEDEWNLEYDWLLSMDEQYYDDFRRRSMTACDASAATALSDSSFEPLTGIMGIVPHFDLNFVAELRFWNSTKTWDEIERMQIREVLREFVPQWKYGKGYNGPMLKLLAQNTFMYFFRHHPNWEDLATQVLSGYDNSAYTNLMTGTPIDLDPIHFETFYQKTEHTGGMVWSSRERQLPLPDFEDVDSEEEHVNASLEHTKVTRFYFLFFSIALILSASFAVKVLTTTPTSVDLYYTEL